MRPPQTPPINELREISGYQSVFSCTDPRGVILVGNAAFQRASGYREDEVVGRPHSIVRHPDTPRAIFLMIWAELHEGVPVVAYLKNLAKDGRFYWVLAVFSKGRDGYLSVRIKPTSEMLATIEPIYAQMRAIETQWERDNDPQMGMLEAVDFLNSELKRRGYRDYRSFMHETLLRGEINSRDRQIGYLASPPLPRIPICAAEGNEACIINALQDAYEAAAGHSAQAAGVYSHANSMFNATQALKRKADEFIHRTGDYTQMAERFRILSTPETPAGRMFGEIGNHLERLAVLNGSMAREMANEVSGLHDSVISAIFHAGLVRVQCEAQGQYIMETLAEYQPGSATPRGVFDTKLEVAEWLLSSVKSSGVQVAQQLTAISDDVHGLSGILSRYRQSLLPSLNGKIGGMLMDDEVQRVCGEAAPSLVNDMQVIIGWVRKDFDELTRMSETLMGKALHSPAACLEARDLVAGLERSARSIHLSRLAKATEAVA